MRLEDYTQEKIAEAIRAIYISFDPKSRLKRGVITFVVRNLRARESLRGRLSRVSRRGGVF
ncbi:hypothetical protein KSD_95290 [Ktedonobacter sp. SOSP1-85]|nr:hypothetical protein KSD_95290 [Ktedonobacter sp. SOSP1-85]